ncbi:hypothetical protein AB0M95_33435 [Sphaerisporangium sp. NPDC051017]|uniref:hypothetical protein n=1 Tax=Sphaerisporangium sp. NPDC051017 TaxID=3154636 RepID=UPI00341736CD
MATAGVKRQHIGVAGGINTVYLAYVRAATGHALIGGRQWKPTEQMSDPVAAITTGLPLHLTFATKGELAMPPIRTSIRTFALRLCACR